MSYKFDLYSLNIDTKPNNDTLKPQRIDNLYVTCETTYKKRNYIIKIVIQKEGHPVFPFGPILYLHKFLMSRLASSVHPSTPIIYYEYDVLDDWCRRLSTFQTSALLFLQIQIISPIHNRCPISIFVTFSL